MYDLIGDIHGHAVPLKTLLGKLGYRDQDGGGLWQHPQRKVIFLGDFIDRGPAQLETVRIARAMVENGTALAVMGNHEFNAVAWATSCSQSPGGYLRAHNAKNLRQHQAFLEAVDEGSQQHDEILQWFRSLPVYLDLPGLRVVHACWHPQSLDLLSGFLDAEQCIRDEAWHQVSRRGTPAYEAMETILKGLEIPLPSDSVFHDKDGNPRRHVRTRWWQTAHKSYRELALLPAEALPDIPDVPVPGSVMPGYDGKKPLFFGHYWLEGEPEPLTPHIACLDYSIARQHRKDSRPGKLCAYRWDGETRLTADKFVWVSG